MLQSAPRIGKNGNLISPFFMRKNFPHCKWHNHEKKIFLLFKNVMNKKPFTQKYLLLLS